MQDPPIAFPCGEPEVSTLRTPPPRPLKILVALHMIRAVASCVLLATQYGSQAPWFAFVQNGLLFALYVGLLRGYKLCWWIVQIWMVCALIYPLAKGFLSGTSLSVFRIYPPIVDNLLSSVAFVLFVYLLTPQAYRFFFPTPKTP